MNRYRNSHSFIKLFQFSTTFFEISYSRFLISSTRALLKASAVLSAMMTSLPEVVRTKNFHRFRDFRIKKSVLPHWSSVRDIERSGPGLLHSVSREDLRYDSESTTARGHVYFRGFYECFHFSYIFMMMIIWLVVRTIILSR